MAGAMAEATQAVRTTAVSTGRPNGPGELRVACHVRLYLLGGFELQIDDDVVDVQPVAQRLLALLALRSNVMERSFVAFQLWPDTTEERAKANLRSTVWRLRRSTGDIVESSKTQMRLASWVWVDVCDGRDPGVADARAQSRGQRRLDAPIDAELLPDWYDDWLVTERERIRQLGLHALEARGNELLAAGRTDEAIQLGLRAAAVEPLRESPHRLVIRCHLAEGNLVEAIHQYDRYAELLGRELCTSPSPLMCELLPIATRGGDHAAPALDAAAAAGAQYSIAAGW